MSGFKRPRTGFDEDQDYQKRMRRLNKPCIAVEAQAREFDQNLLQELHDKKSRQKNKETVLNLLLNYEQHYPVFDRLCSYLDISEIIALTRTCKKLSGLYKLLLHTQWNVDRRLRRFFGNPKRFRAQLGKHGALVAGDFALQFFERQVWPECDMDIIIDTKQDVLAFKKYLVDIEGYTCSSTLPLQEPNEWPDQIILTFSRFDRDQVYMKTPMIKLHSSYAIPLQYMFENAFTTSLVNIISWNKAYSIFPLPTHLQHKTYLLTGINDDVGAVLSEQSQRGWDVQDVLWQEEELCRHPIQSQRFVGDEFTWSIPFDTDDMELSLTPDSVLQYSQFGLEQHTRLVQHAESYHYRISSTIYGACTLRYKYTHSGFERNFWDEFVRDRMNRLTRLQLYQMKPEDRPPGAFDRRDFSVHEDAFEKPRNWKYYDDKVPEWYVVWKKEEAIQRGINDWQIGEVRHA